MSSKSDIDNRANQLNPNNDAYYSSRGISRGEGADDEDDVAYHAPYRPPMRNCSETHSVEFRAGFVSFSGKTLTLRFLVYKTINAAFLGAASNAVLDMEDYAERILRTIRGKLPLEWGGSAFAALFNVRGQELAWMTDEYNPEGYSGRSMEKDRDWFANSQRECQIVRRQLAAQNAELDDMGAFEILGSKLLSKDHEEQISAFLRTKLSGQSDKLGCA